MNTLVSPDEFRTPAEDAFTDAIRALSKLYLLASDAGIRSLMTRTEAATRELIGWHHDKPRAKPQNFTLVNFPPRSDDPTR